MKIYWAIVISLFFVIGCLRSTVQTTSTIQTTSKLGCSRFTFNTLAAPIPISPEARAVFHHYPRTTDLEWHPVPDAASYSVEVDCFDCCKSGKWCSEVDKLFISVSSISDTSYTFEWVGANLGRWRVWAVSKDGKEGYKSAWQEFFYTK